MRQVDLIVIHCSATPDGRRTTVEDIDGWHRERGFRRLAQWRKACNPELTSIGYHFVLYLNGAIISGRHLDEVGAHVRGYNADSVGVCMVGQGRYSRMQWVALASNITALLKRYPTARVVGHRDLDKGKDCPCFDVAAWIASGMAPPEAHILKEPS